MSGEHSLVADTLSMSGEHSLVADGQNEGATYSRVGRAAAEGDGGRGSRWEREETRCFSTDATRQMGMRKRIVRQKSWPTDSSAGFMCSSCFRRSRSFWCSDTHTH